MCWSISFSKSFVRATQRSTLSLILRISCCSNFFSRLSSLTFMRNFFSMTADFFLLAVIGALSFSSFFSIRSCSVYIGITLLCCFWRSFSAFSRSLLFLFSSLLNSVPRWLISCIFVSNALLATATSLIAFCFSLIWLSISLAIASGSLKARIILSSWTTASLDLLMAELILSRSCIIESLFFNSFFCCLVTFIDWNRLAYKLSTSSTGLPSIRSVNVSICLTWLPGPPKYTASISSVLLEMVLRTSEKYCKELSNSLPNLATGVANSCCASAQGILSVSSGILSSTSIPYFTRKSSATSRSTSNTCRPTLNILQSGK